MTAHALSRRTVLKGLGVSMALPVLDAMFPGLAFGRQAAARAFPRRMAFCYVPNGVLYSQWNPIGAGRNYVLSKTLEAMAPFRDDILVLSGLTCDKARPNGDGTGDHARAQAAFLTGKQPRKSTTEIRAGISVDQLCAQRIGDRTRLPSLEIGCEGARQAGGCDPGYACAYTSNLSWRGESTPAPKEINPRAVFDRLFASADARETDNSRRRREQYNQSILDFVLEDARSLNNQLGLNDRRRLDEYISSIREVERRIGTFAPTQAQTAAPAKPPPDSAPSDYRLHLRLMADLVTVAFQIDATRICTFVFSNEITNRSYRFIDVPEGHHDISHHTFDPVKMEKVAKIDRFHIEQFAYLLGRMKAIPEGNGTLLDNCMVLYGSGNGEGARHNHDDLPILMAGKGGGTVTPGRHIRYPQNTPVCNLFLEMLDRMDVQVDSFGDSTGRLRNLT
jgi:hypothetical protein